MLKSVMSLPDASVILKALGTFRDYVIPHDLDKDIVLFQRTAAEARYRLAEYNYDQFKIRLKKKKKVSEEELRFLQEDMRLAGKALFRT